MSNFLIDELNSFEHYNLDVNRRQISSRKMSDADVSEFLEIIHLLDSKFVDYNILDNFNITILGKK